MHSSWATKHRKVKVYRSILQIFILRSNNKAPHRINSNLIFKADEWQSEQASWNQSDRNISRSLWSGWKVSLQSMMANRIFSFRWKFIMYNLRSSPAFLQLQRLTRSTRGLLPLVLRLGTWIPLPGTSASANVKYGALCALRIHMDVRACKMLFSEYRKMSSWRDHWLLFSFFSPS